MVQGNEAGPSEGSTSSSASDKRVPRQSLRSIPLHFRIVPKDIWLRMHVDTSSTIGSVKDAVLDKLRMPLDPSLDPYFLEDARAMSSKVHLSAGDGRAFPKTFLARSPKRTVEEVLAVDEERRNTSKTLERTRQEISKAHKQQDKSRALRSAATAVLGGDPGEGGLGKMLANGLPVSAIVSTMDIQPKPRLAPNAARAKQSQPPVRPDSFATKDSSSRMAENQSGLAENTLLHQTSSVRQGAEERQGDTDDALDSHFGAYDDFYTGGLPGNEAAKRSEQEAMTSMRSFDSTVSPSPQPDHTGFGTATIPGEDSPLSKASQQVNNDNDDDDDGEDGESDIDHGSAEDLVRYTRDLSIHSSSSESSVASHVAVAPTTALDNNALPMTRVTSTSSTPSERLRSGTIVPGDFQQPPGACSADVSLANPIYVRDMASAPAGAHDQSMVSIENLDHSSPPTRRARSGTLVQSELPTSTKETATAEDSEESDLSKSQPAANISKAISNQARRLAGINTNEISSWRDATHGLARHFAVHSYANGNTLEDWRTVAAFRLRPFELLELQYVHPYDKIHIPRAGEASLASAARGASSTYPMPRGDPSVPSSADYNPALDKLYLAPYCGGWCYIYKRGSGTSKAQRAGLGLWKLRWISIRGAKMTVHRKKPLRGETDLDADVWNLESLDSVFSEQADGATRPMLPQIEGSCRDLMTLSFRGFFAPARSNQGDDAQNVLSTTLSIRFVTQVDHCAFFATFARAHTRYAMQHRSPSLSQLALEWRRRALARATIAGLGGVVIPGKAARRRGRNSLARTRLRPPGASREFDDADRWSSESESEDVTPRPHASDFSYGGGSFETEAYRFVPIPSLFEALDVQARPIVSLTRSNEPILKQAVQNEHNVFGGTSLSAKSTARTSPSGLPAWPDPAKHGPAHETGDLIARHASSTQLPGSMSTPQRGPTLAAQMRLPSQSASSQTSSLAQGSSFSRGSPSQTTSTAHDLRRQQRYEGQKNVGTEERKEQSVEVVGDEVDDSFEMVKPSHSASYQEVQLSSSQASQRHDFGAKSQRGGQDSDVAREFVGNSLPTLYGQQTTESTAALPGRSPKPSPIADKWGEGFSRAHPKTSDSSSMPARFKHSPRKSSIGGRFDTANPVMQRHSDTRVFDGTGHEGYGGSGARSFLHAPLAATHTAAPSEQAQSFALPHRMVRTISASAQAPSSAGFPVRPTDYGADATGHAGSGSGGEGDGTGHPASSSVPDTLSRILRP